MSGDDLFRREWGRLLSALTRVFGVEHLALAEDVVQDTLAHAFEAWRQSGVPAHSSALLMTAAKNRAVDVLRRQRTARKFAPELARFLESEWTLRPSVEALFLPDALKDDQLRMMFSCCSPLVDEDVQVALVLHLLCGFGVGEIASAFLVSVAAVEKRLSRGKKALAESTRLFDLTAKDFAPRLAAVHRALYLLFSEGYHGASRSAVIRSELCAEAMRLVCLLVDHAPAATSATHALAALMHLHAARLPGRLDASGELTSFFDQDRSRWDAALIAEGLELLARSAIGSGLSAWHLEAAIAALHATAARAGDTPWGEIVELYDALMKVSPSPVIALNRAMAIAQHQGPLRGLEELRAIARVERLAQYPFYPAALGELELRSGRPDAARAHFRAAYGLARNEVERRFLQRRVADCERQPGAAVP